MATLSFTRTPFVIQHTNQTIRQTLKSLIVAGLEACNPSLAIARTFSFHNNRLQAKNVQYDLTQYDRVIIAGAGKASGRMAIALEQMLGYQLEGGIVIVKDGAGATCRKVHILEGGHPVPDRRSVNATKKLLSLVHSLTPNDLLIVLLSGGASSLLCAPSAGITLADKQRTTRLLLRSGAPIHAINIVRKHLSAIKGGRLAQATSAHILTLIISDVFGDDLATIGSGPTVTDPSTFQDANEILQQYRIWDKVPDSVRRHLQKGLTIKIHETRKPTKLRAFRNRHIILANNRHALEGIAKAARKLHLKPFILPFPLLGEAKEIGNILGEFARDLFEFGNPVRPPACLIAGGEPTVTVKGQGKGGRAQECVLAAAQHLTGLRNVVVAGFGTDGIDGPTDVAGALVDGKTIQRATKVGLSVENTLKNHDSYPFFKHIRGHIMTGPTGTNVNDIYLIIAM